MEGGELELITSPSPFSFSSRRLFVRSLEPKSHLMVTSLSSLDIQTTLVTSVKVCRSSQEVSPLEEMEADPVHSFLPFVSSSSALRFLQDDTVPWHRVLAATGKISHRGDNGEGAERQRRALEAEGVEVEDEPGGGGGGKVNLRTWGWFPTVDAVDGDGDEVEE